MAVAVTALIVAATLGLAVLLSSPFADKHPAVETAVFIMIYAFLVAFVIGSILSVLSVTLGVL
jgi:hypothetical protein|nr:MAG TPA: hypothetical protein [Caudoviricetes sp.]